MMTMDWQDALQEAIHESDPQIVGEKIRAAEAAISLECKISLLALTHSKNKRCSTGPLESCEAPDGFQNIHFAGR
jgi:hypothetical protein